MKNRGYKIALAVCLTAFVATSGVMAYKYVTKSKAETTMQEIVESVQPESEAESVPPTSAPAPTEAVLPSDTPTPSPVPTLDPLAERGIVIPEKNINWEDLWNQNPDIYAWIYIPNTEIDYPILQHPEIKSFYLEHNIDGSEGFPGCIYTQNVNSKDWTDPNTVIYGHNMNEGTMFHDLHNFEDSAFFEDNRYVFIYTPEGVNVYDIFASYPFSNVDLMMCFDYSTPDAVLMYFDGIWTNRDMTSNFRDDVELYGDDRIITMSTCINGQPEMRYLVQGVLVNP